MKKIIVLIFTFILLLSFVGCRPEEKEPVVWNDIDLTYWAENSEADGMFTAAISSLGRTSSSKDMSFEVVELLCKTEAVPKEETDYFTYVQDKEYYFIQLINPEDIAENKYLVLTEEFSVMAVFENLSENISGGILHYPAPAVFSVNNPQGIIDLFNKYDFRV